MSLVACLGPMQEMGMNSNTLPPSLGCKHWDTWFLNSSKSKIAWNSWNLACYHGEASTCRGKIFVPFGVDLGMSFSQTRGSNNKRDGFGRERATFGDEMISDASYCFQKNSSVNIERHKYCVQFWNFSRFVWTFLYINWVFQAFYVHNSNFNYMHIFKCI